MVQIIPVIPQECTQGSAHIGTLFQQHTIASQVGLRAFEVVKEISHGRVSVSFVEGNLDCASAADIVEGGVMEEHIVDGVKKFSCGEQVTEI